MAAPRPRTDGGARMSEEQERALSFGVGRGGLRGGATRLAAKAVRGRCSRASPSSIQDQPDIVDIAAGTGKLTRTLAQLAGTLVAVEPDADAARGARSACCRRWTLFAEHAEELPLESGERRCGEPPGRHSTGSTWNGRSGGDRTGAAPGRRRDRGLELTARGRHLVRRRDRLPARRQSGSPARAHTRLGRGTSRHRPSASYFEKNRPARADEQSRELCAPARHPQHHQPPAARAAGPR